MKSNHRCECGCGKKTNMYRGKPRKFIIWHYQRTDEFKELHSKQMSGKNNHNFGKPRDPSTIKKISKSNKTYWNKPKNRKRRSIQLLGNQNGLGHMVTKKHKKVLSQMMTENNPMGSKK